MQMGTQSGANGGMVGTGPALIVAGLLVSASIVFAGLTSRYEVAYGENGLALRLDRLTGVIEVCLTRPAERSEDAPGRPLYVLRCTPANTPTR
jgi:hypothetical protein